ncbi:MAG: RNA polymerase sigma factor [Candidatus Cloacimonadota bacterium]|nr:RNA polymerase sigma factor [Candidatus Cloacimonadota bacterium]
MKRSEINLLFQENYKKIFLLSVKMLKNYEDAEDATQEIFMKAYQNIDKFRQESKLFTWLYRIALNHIYNFSNKKKNVKNLNEKNQDFCIRTNETPEKVLYEKELYNKLNEIIEGLSPKQKEVFLLRYYNGLKFNEIAKILKKSLGTIKSNYFFAMQKIKKELEKEQLLETKEVS